MVKVRTVRGTIDFIAKKYLTYWVRQGYVVAWQEGKKWVSVY